MGKKGAILLAARGDGTKCFFVYGLSQKVVDSGNYSGYYFFLKYINLAKRM